MSDMYPEGNVSSLCMSTFDRKGPLCLTFSTFNLSSPVCGYLDRTSYNYLQSYLSETYVNIYLGIS